VPYYLFYVSQNAVYFITLPVSVQIILMFLMNHVLKLKPAELFKA